MKRIRMDWPGGGPSVMPFLSMETMATELDTSTAVPTGDRSTTAIRTWYFPALAFIDLEDVDFELKDRLSYDLSDDDVLPRTMADALVDAIQERRGSPYEITSVSMRKCRRIPAWLIDWMQHTLGDGKFKWDGINDDLNLGTTSAAMVEINGPALPFCLE